MTFLQGKVFLIVFGEIQHLGLGWDSFTGIIMKAAALLVDGAHAFFGTKDVAIFQQYTVGAVGAGSFDLFTKQHNGSLHRILITLYMNRLYNATVIFGFIRIYQEICN